MRRIAPLLAILSAIAWTPAFAGEPCFESSEPEVNISACTKLISNRSTKKQILANAYGSRSWAYLQKGAFDLAIADIAEAIKLQPDDPRGYVSRANVYLRRGDFEKALIDYNEAIRLKPNFGGGYEGRAMTYRHMGDLDRAIQDYNRALKLGSTQVHTIYINRGVALVENGELDQAIADLDKGIQLDPRSFWGFSYRGKAYLEKGDLDRASADFDEALKLSPDFAVALAGRGETALKKGDKAQAQTDLEAALSAVASDTEEREAQESARKLLAALEVQDRPRPTITPQTPLATSFTGKRVALVIGNSAYGSIGRLDNPAKDARLMAEALKEDGFTLVGGGAQLDLDKSSFDKAVQDFGKNLQGANVGLFYYAGHGVQLRGDNYLIPIDANPTRESDADFQMLNANLVLRQMEDAGTRLNLVMLDACRNNPLAGRGLRAAGGGLAQMQAPEGTVISFATEPGTVAQDGFDGNSPYTKALAQAIRTPGLGIFDTFNQVGLKVKKATGGAQKPWQSSSPIEGAFFFRPGT
jgi:tetratricopeptide (TPR) repeat protein